MFLFVICFLIITQFKTSQLSASFSVIVMAVLLHSHGAGNVIF